MIDETNETNGTNETVGIIGTDNVSTQETKDKIAAQKKIQNLKKASKIAASRPKSTPAPVSKSVKEEIDSQICYFTMADMRRDHETGEMRIVNTYPLYYSNTQRDDIAEERRMIEKAIEGGLYDPVEMPEVKKRLKTLRDKEEMFAHIEPRHLEAKKDSISKLNRRIETILRDSMFSRREMEKGLADPHEEARRMSEPVISLPREIQGLAVANGIAVSSSGKINRNDLVRVWQMGQKVLGEYTDVEYIRKER